MYKKPLFLLLLAIIIFSPLNFQTGENFLRADISHEGWKQIISTNTTWTKENGPYIIDGPLLVDEMVKLTIEAGTVIKLDKSYILILGELEATGKEDEKIVFTSIYDDKEVMDNNPSDNRAPEKGDWGSIFIYYRTGRANFDNVVFKYGGTMYDPISGVESEIGAVFAARDSYVRITNSEISNNTLGIYAYRPDFEMHNSIIVDNDTAMIGESMDYGEDGEIIDPPIVAINNYWGHASGPHHETINPDGIGNPIIDNVKFTPWLTEPPHIIGTEEEKRNPVIIVPGIMGSVLNEPGNDNEMWPNLLKMMLPGDDSYLDELAFDNLGRPNNNVAPRDILRSVGGQDLFTGLIDELKSEGYVEGVDLFVFPYDWRLDIDRVSGQHYTSGVVSLNAKIEEVKNSTGKSSVDLIAHSMGGLVVKSYIESFGTSSIDQFIDIATPHLGAPKAFKVLTYGDDMGFSVLGLGANEKTVKNISQNMPSIYQLLPSKKYFESFSTPQGASYIYDVMDFDGDGIRGKLNFDSGKYFMANTGRNPQLITAAESFHDRLDNVRYEKALNIVACGHPTIGSVFIVNKKNSEFTYGLRYIDGDGTVPLPSADALNATTIYTNGSQHAFAPSSLSVRKLIGFKLGYRGGSELGQYSSGFGIDDYRDMSIEKEDVCSISGTQISFHSPIDLHVYDDMGRHIGPNDNGDIDLEIPGAAYDIIDNNKFVFLPEGNFHVEGRATDVGEFDVRVSKIENDEYVKTASFTSLPLASTGTRASIDVYEDIEDMVVEIDSDGSGENDEVYSPSMINPGYIESEISNSITWGDFIGIVNSIQDGFDGSMKSFFVEYLEWDAAEAGDIDRIISQLEVDLVVAQSQNFPPDQISQIESSLNAVYNKRDLIGTERIRNTKEAIDWMHEEGYMSLEIYDTINNSLELIK